ncbi:hypothetical protein STENM223S_03218 [Streptomyces tendae]
MWETSPRVRGAVDPGVGAVVEQGTFPAGAGSRSSQPTSLARWWAIPTPAGMLLLRSRPRDRAQLLPHGDGPGVLSMRIADAVCSPRPRGWSFRGTRSGGRSTLLAAHAGTVLAYHDQAPRRHGVLPTSGAREGRGAGGAAASAVGVCAAWGGAGGHGRISGGQTTFRPGRGPRRGRCVTPQPAARGQSACRRCAYRDGAALRAVDGTLAVGGRGFAARRPSSARTHPGHASSSRLPARASSPRS